MSKYSFEIKTSSDLFIKFEDDLRIYESQKDSSSHAINCAIVSWHLIDWLHAEKKHTQIDKKIKDLKSFKKYIKNKCRSFYIMQDITNGSKHFTLTYTSLIAETKKHVGEFNNSFNEGFNINRLIITLDNGDVKYFDLEIVEVYNFWKDIFEKNNWI